MPVALKWSNEAFVDDKDLLDDVMEELMNEWVMLAKQSLIKRLKRKKLDASGELIRSFESSVRKEAFGRVALEFGFEDHGRIRDMKNVRYRKKQPPSKQIEKWIDHIGLQNFKYIPGYKNTKKPMLSIPSAKSRLAYGIARSKRLKEVKQKARTWYNKNFWSLISELETKLLESISPNLLQDLKGGVEG